MIGKVNDKSIRNAHWMGFLGLIPANRPVQVPLFTMSNDEYVQFEDYVKNSPEFEFLANLDTKLLAAKHI